MTHWQINSRWHLVFCIFARQGSAGHRRLAINFAALILICFFLRDFLCFNYIINEYERYKPEIVSGRTQFPRRLHRVTGNICDVELPFAQATLHFYIAGYTRKSKQAHKWLQIKRYWRWIFLSILNRKSYCKSFHLWFRSVTDLQWVNSTERGQSNLN